MTTHWEGSQIPAYPLSVNLLIKQREGACRDLFQQSVCCLAKPPTLNLAKPKTTQIVVAFCFYVCLEKFANESWIEARSGQTCADNSEVCGLLWANRHA